MTFIQAYVVLVQFSHRPILIFRNVEFLSVICCFRYLYKNHIRSLEVDAFRGLTNLNQL